MTARPLEDRVAIVTGGGRGIGRALAAALAAAGARVAVAGRDEAALESAAAEIRADGGDVLAVRADVSVADDVARLVTTATAALGPVDVLVNNAGVTGEGPFLDTPDDVMSAVVATNLVGVALCTREVGRTFANAGRGKVINISSTFGEKGRPNHAMYSATKAALHGLTRALAVEWAPYGVQVNAVAPGLIATEINAAAREDPERLRRLVGQIPARRAGEPRELGPLVVFLASSGSDYITGAVIPIDGGWHAR